MLTKSHYPLLLILETWVTMQEWHKSKGRSFSHFPKEFCYKKAFVNYVTASQLNPCYRNFHDKPLGSHISCFTSTPCLQTELLYVVLMIKLSLCKNRHLCSGAVLHGHHDLCAWQLFPELLWLCIHCLEVSHTWTLLKCEPSPVALKVCSLKGLLCVSLDVDNVPNIFFRSKKNIQQKWNTLCEVTQMLNGELIYSVIVQPAREQAYQCKKKHFHLYSESSP